MRSLPVVAVVVHDAQVHEQRGKLGFGDVRDDGNEVFEGRDRMGTAVAFTCRRRGTDIGRTSQSVAHTSFRPRRILETFRTAPTLRSGLRSMAATARRVLDAAAASPRTSSLSVSPLFFLSLVFLSLSLFSCLLVLLLSLVLLFLLGFLPLPRTHVVCACTDHASNTCRQSTHENRDALQCPAWPFTWCALLQRVAAILALEPHHRERRRAAAALDATCWWITTRPDARAEHSSH